MLVASGGYFPNKQSRTQDANNLLI